MDKKSLAILLVASCFASSAFATNIIKELITKRHSANPSVKTHKLIKQTNKPYTDFSGTWTVNCGDNYQSGPTVIKNDAHFISLDGYEFRIGQGLEGHSDSNENYTNSTYTSFEWNEDGSVLTMKGVDLSKVNEPNSEIETFVSKLTFTMKNGQINLDSKVIMLEDESQVGPQSMHCVFTKNQ